MNHSMYNADYRTHIKVIGLGLVCALLVAAVGKYGHIGPVDLGTAPLVKVGRMTAMSGDTPVIR
jgi:hypothetical protein